MLAELSANALKYGGGAATVTLHRLRDAWLIEVRDAAEHEAPALHPPDRVASDATGS